MDKKQKGTVTLRIPSTLGAYSAGKSQIVLHATTIEEMLNCLQQEYHEIWACLCTEQGTIRSQVQMFVSNQQIKSPASLKTPLKSGQEVIILTTTGL